MNLILIKHPLFFLLFFFFFFSNQTLAQQSNLPPVAPDIEDVILHNIEELEITLEFSASEAYDPDGQIDSTFWFHGYGSDTLLVSKDINTNIGFRQGSSEITLIVMDNEGATDTTSFKVHIDSGFIEFPDSVNSQSGISVIGNLGDIIIPVQQKGLYKITHKFSNFKDSLRFPLSYSFSGTSSISSDGTIFVPTQSGDLFALEEDGQLNWIQTGNFDHTPIIDYSQDKIYANSENGLITALDIQNGSVLWSFNLNHELSHPGVLLNQNTLVIATKSGRLYFFDLRKSLEEQNMEPNGYFDLTRTVSGALAIDSENHLIVSTNDGFILKIEPDISQPSGSTILWLKKITSGAMGSPVVDSFDNIYVTGSDSTLYGLNGSNGQQFWEFKAQSKITTTPTINQFFIYLGDEAGTVYAFNILDDFYLYSDAGTLAWTFETGSAITNSTAYLREFFVFITQDGRLFRINDGLNPIPVKSISNQCCNPHWGTYLGNYTRNGQQSEFLYTSNEPENKDQPRTYRLSQNYPNPFNPSTTISYRLPSASKVVIEVFSLTGRKIATLLSENKPAGTYETVFDGSGISSGIYFYQIKLDSYTEVRKMTLIK